MLKSKEHNNKASQGQNKSHGKNKSNKLTNKTKSYAKVDNAKVHKGKVNNGKVNKGKVNKSSDKPPKPKSAFSKLKYRPDEAFVLLSSKMSSAEEIVVRNHLKYHYQQISNAKSSIAS